MNIESFKQKWDYADILNAARTTVGKWEINSTENKKLIEKLIRSEHSPSRVISFNALIKDVKYWVSVHLTRHKFWVEHFVSTQRDDRNDKEVSRDDAPQSQLVEHRLEFNPQAAINISRKRLCYLASKETREAWSEVVSHLPPEVASSCVIDCIYRWYCRELKPCWYSDTPKAQQERAKYLNWRPQIEVPKFNSYETWQ
jgi:hypothetical protein